MGALIIFGRIFEAAFFVGDENFSVQSEIEWSHHRLRENDRLVKETNVAITAQ
ncbi:hypothetical protein [Paenibacillus sp. NPDC057967]|uniref:hypothetical protein n=1 Tax=Paenibacillus sp. NPDC057967 TaxID=3346293 RepID=UPI0036DA0BC3